jgi:hypothetical protein
MEELEFGKALTVFHNVGQLMELLKNYPDRTPVTVCGTPGLFYKDECTQSLLLETMDSSGYEAISERMEATGDQEYMDF